MIRIGCAGWSLPRAVQEQFAAGDNHLARYASRFNASEINSSFHRPHARWVYERWAASVPESFRFCAKLPRTITHDQRLVDCAQPLRTFLDEAAGLGDKLAALLVQLPPSLAFDARIARGFLDMLRGEHDGRVALEPRHASWFDPQADELLRALRVSRVLADPVRHEAGRLPGGWPQLVYLRLHGSPRVYYSAYQPQLLRTLADRIALARREGHEVWCIFDNTASGAAAGDALALLDLLAKDLP